MTKVSTSERYKSNPFLDSLEIKTRNKQVRISPAGKDNNVLVNQATGEATGTHVVSYKRVEEAEFVKLFARNIALTFELRASGIKAFNVLLWAIQFEGIQRDQVPLDKFMLEEFIQAHEGSLKPLNLSYTTFMRGLRELVVAQIVAKTTRKGTYFINPSFCFNGSRIAFTTVIEKKNNDNQDTLD
ncbi:MAG: hypothetical protein R8K20_07220 [Gallionellaceae bacterium]